MLGAIIGDIAGSRFEHRSRSIKSKQFELFAPACSVTDDSVMTLAVAKAVMDCKPDRSDLGGDSDTLAAIAGGVAQAYYGIPDGLRQGALGYLDMRLTSILSAFESRFMA